MADQIPILLMVRALGPGGTERQLTEVARSLDRSRFQVHVGCFHLGPRAEELRAAGVRILQLPVTSFMRPGALVGAWQFGRYIQRHQIRIVHTFDYPMNCFGVPLARLFRVPVVLSSQRAHRNLTPALYWKILRWTDGLVDGIVVNSEAVRQDMIQSERVSPARLHLCYNGIDTASFHAGNRMRQPLVAGASMVIGVVCVLRPEKGLTTLIEAFAVVSHEEPGAKLVIVGSGPELGRLTELAARVGVGDKVVFQPATTDVAGWLRSLDIFVLPSLSEALSNSLMEAMSCGCACVASRTGGNPELVQDGESGLLFPVGAADELAGSLLRLMRDSTLRDRLAEAAMRTIREKFSLGASVRRMQEIYEERLGG